MNFTTGQVVSGINKPAAYKMQFYIKNWDMFSKLQWSPQPEEDTSNNNSHFIHLLICLTAQWCLLNIC